MAKRRIVVGISGASGVPIAIEVLKQLKKAQIETHLIYTKGTELTLKQETDINLEELHKMADFIYNNENIGDKTASGTFKTDGMIIVPCSMKTLAGIHCGYSDNLLFRTADVTLKERRKLVLVTRETPLSSIHLRNMYELSMMGVVIIPPMLTYYNNPKTIEDCTKHIAGKILDQFGIELDEFYRWNGMEQI